MPPLFDRCPICAAPLQATLTRDLENVVAGPSGRVVSGDPAREDELSLCCENDHTWPEMAAALAEAQAQTQ